ncbi:MAG: hypothetical protein ACFFBD_06370 [Candidatus Hodarchaeota archaeon]
MVACPCGDVSHLAAVDVWSPAIYPHTSCPFIPQTALFRVAQGDANICVLLDCRGKKDKENRWDDSYLRRFDRVASVFALDG